MPQTTSEEVARAKKLHHQGQEHRLHQRWGGRYIKDIIYGANDGIITTFAIVSGVAGADLSINIVLVLGLAKVMADAISMGASNFLGSKSEADYYEREWKAEAWEIKHLPEEEKAEVRRICREKGFCGADLERAVEIITSNKERWIDTMMQEEHGLVRNLEARPWKKGLVAFGAFIAAGMLPLLSYIFLAYFASPFLVSFIITALALFVVGAMRTWITRKTWWLSGLEMLGVGTVASGAAYGIGFLLKGFI